MGGSSQGGALISRLAHDARRDMASMEKNDAALAGCLAACALILVAAVAAVIAFRRYGIDLADLPASATLYIAIALPVLGLAAVLAYVTVRRAVYAVATARNAELLGRFTEHFRKVLYDQGLLALVLGNDPRFSVPSVAQYLGVQPSQGQRGTAEAMASFRQRVELLLNCYGLLCRHYRIEPYPEDNPFAQRGIDPIRLRGLPRRAMIFALEEGIDESGTELPESQA